MEILKRLWANRLVKTGIVMVVVGTLVTLGIISAEVGSQVCAAFGTVC